MAAGIPAVATMVAATSLLIKDGVNGLLIPPNNVSSLADSMLSLWKDKEKRAILSGNGRETAKRYYWEEYAVKLMRIYSEVLGRPVS
jgi:glycosyltransferase involved in cell wall biosynthesis